MWVIQNMEHSFIAANHSSELQLKQYSNLYIIPFSPWKMEIWIPALFPISNEVIYFKAFFKTTEYYRMSKD